MINYSLDSTPELSSGLCYYYQLMVSHRFEKQRKLQLHKSGPRIIKDREERWASYAALITLEKRKPADRGSADGVKCQLFTAPKTPTYSLFPLLLSVSSHPFSRPKRGPLLRTAFSLLSHSHLSSFYIVYPLCPSSVLAFISPSAIPPNPPHPTVALSCSHNPYFCLYLQWRRCRGSVIGIQALSEPMQSPVSRIREETSLSGFPR